MKCFTPLLLLAAAALAGCAVDADYPSLAQRPIEKLAAANLPEPTEPAAVPGDAPLSAEARTAVAAAEQSDAQFRAELALAEATVAAAQGAAPSGEAWVVAQQAVSRADSARLATAAALAALDAAQLEADGAPSAALLDAMRRITALDRAQSDALAALIAQLPAP